LLALGAAILIIFGSLPFFTLGEDTLMYKDVSLDIILLLTGMIVLFCASKSIYEEIEDRTMLTLMSKPLKRWEVMVGKYLGISLACLLAVAALGAVMILCVWLRIPSDYGLRATALDEKERQMVYDDRVMHIAGMLPSLVLVWLEMSVLAAVGVALSVRFSLVVNLPTVIMVYIGGNLTRFLFPLDTGPLRDSAIGKGVAWFVSLLLPYLEVFDLRHIAILGIVKVPGTQYADSATGVSQSVLWGYVAVATIYAVGYAGFALSAGMWLFQSRELGGGEE
jgi:ABC-type transport system involved in multi-copper enzyme maturation permease subunit